MKNGKQVNKNTTTNTTTINVNKTKIMKKPMFTFKAISRR